MHSPTGWLPERPDAVVLAGADNRGALRQASPEPYEALIPVGGKPMVAHVVRTLSRARRVGRIVCVGPPPVVQAARRELQATGQPDRLVPIDPGPGLLANIERGLAEAGTPYALLVTADIPLLLPHMVDDFVARCEELGEPQDVCYAVVERSVGEGRYPGVRRTWVRLMDGTFTGGNLALVERRIVERTRALLERALRARKSPIGMARLLGFSVLWRFVRGRLSMVDVERRVSAMLGIRGRAVITPYPEIGIDVDKPADLALAHRHLAQT